MKEKVKFKIGQEVEAQQDFELQGYFDEEAIQVKAGSKGVVTSNGYLLHTTGEARGKLQRMSDEVFEIKGYDTENIAQMIIDRLCSCFNLEDMLDDQGYEIDYFKQEIDYVLDEIL